MRYQNSAELVTAFVQEYTSDNGHPPSEEEIGLAVGVGKSRVSEILARMEEDGLIERARTPLGHPMPRTVRVAHMIEGRNRL